MNCDAEDKSQPVGISGCLVLPVAGCCCLWLPVIALLFMVSATPVGGRISRLPANTRSASRLGQTPTPKAGQAADIPANTSRQGALPLSADPANGKQLFNTFQPAAGIACATCHRVDSEERLVGPGLLDVGKRAQTRIQGLSAVAYLRRSIVNPSAYVVEGYADLMPKNWGQVFSEKQIDDLIAYLLTLRGG
jgi:mono/diheme cytochrome c family protein